MVPLRRRCAALTDDRYILAELRRRVAPRLDDPIFVAGQRVNLKLCRQYFSLRGVTARCTTEYAFLAEWRGEKKGESGFMLCPAVLRLYCCCCSVLVVGRLCATTIDCGKYTKDKA